jgi:hypothetical protein
LVKILKFFDVHPGSRIRDGKNSDTRSGIQDGKIWIQDTGSRMEKTRIRDPGSRVKHPVSAKQEISSPNLLGIKELNNYLTLCGKGILG